MTFKTAIYLFWVKNSFLIICAFIVFGFTVYHRLDNISFWKVPRFFHCDPAPYLNHPNRFTGYVDTSADVPDIVHYIRFGSSAKCFSEDQVDALLSVVRYHRPAKIYIHTDDVEAVQESIAKISSDYSLNYQITVNYYPQPKHAFGISFSRQKWMKHAVDFTKLKILRRYGGIFLDNNVHLIRNLKKYLNYEMTVILRPRPGEEVPVDLRDDVIIAHRDARFLHMWLRTYHEYDDRELKHSLSPTMKVLLQKNAKFVHKLENDLPENLSSKDKSLVMSNRKYFFVTVTKDKSRCIL